MNKNNYSISQFSERINKSISTLRRWDSTGELVANRHKSGHRYYTDEHLRKLLNLVEEEERKVVVYCRVSSSNQKDDLSSQVEAMSTFCLNSGIAIGDLVKEVGGGMNFKRKKFLQLMNDIQYGKVSKLLIAHKDRLCRFGFDYFEHLCKVCNTELVVVNQEKLSPEKEMVEDLLSIVHTFSCRLYGLRSYKKKIKDELKK